MFAHLIDRDDMRMVDCGGRLALPEKSLPRDGIFGPAGVHQLDGDTAAKLVIATEIDPTHAAMADQPLDCKATNRLGKFSGGTIDKRVGRLPAAPLHGPLFTAVGVKDDRL